MSQCSVVPAFMAAAKDLLETSGVSAEVLLAKALAKTAVGLSLTSFWFFVVICLKAKQSSKAFWNGGLLQGFTEIKKRSLLTSMENHVTLVLEAGRPMYSAS